MERIEYLGWPNCYRLSNGVIDIVATTDVGPRLIRFGFVDGPNLFKEYEEMAGQTGGDEWRIYGGHRLWHAPELDPRTYAPDNGPVQIEEHDGFVRLIQDTEATTGIQKEIDIYLHPTEAKARIVHRLRNRGVWAVELAPWSSSVMAAGAICVFPLPPRGAHPSNLTPVSSLCLWDFTDLSDPRWFLGKKYFMLRQDESRPVPQKMGALVPDGWATCSIHGQLFIKRYGFDPNARYTDLGSNFETFTNGVMLELETLGPLINLAPDAIVEHTEEWQLVADVPAPQNEADIERHIIGHIRES